MLLLVTCRTSNEGGSAAVPSKPNLTHTYKAHQHSAYGDLLLMGLSTLSHCVLAGAICS